MVERRSCLADWLETAFGLTGSERTYLDQIEQPPRIVRRGAVIRRENERGGELLVVRKGWLYSAVLLPDGNRQIIRLFFPGEIAAFAGAPFDHAVETLVAVTDVELCAIDRAEMRTLFGAHPRLGAMLLAISQLEQVSLADRLAAVGRLPARGRVAALLAEILTKSRRANHQQGSMIQLTLTQEEIGDATGLTAVHVNRMLRSLSEDGVIARESGTLRIVDEARLRAIGNYTDRQLQFDPSWLPVAV